MNALRIAPRCLVGRPTATTTAGQLCRPNLAPLLLSATHPARQQQQLRHRSWFGWGRKKDEEVPSASPDSRSLKELLKASPKTTNTVVPQLERGGLSSSSIFDGEDAAADAAAPTEVGGPRTISDREYLATVDPQREYQWSWPQRFEARQHRRRGRLNKTLRILRTEKSHTAKSHWIKTSIKKLAPLARQISGMKLNDAIVQMRFSSKKASREVLGHLIEMRTEAVVRREMDPEEMYVSQAWVGRGTYEKELNHRARGRIDMLYKPWTSVTIELKEEATRRRLAEEAATKKAKQKVWVQLPNKPIYGQRQYYQW